jgi:predicted nucleic acid-binding Zn ribbon protein
MPEPEPEPAGDPGPAASAVVPETIATYLRLRGLPPSARRLKRRRRREDDENQPFTAGRDPRGLGDVLTALTREAGWDGRLSQEDLVLRWAEIAGAETAQHAAPVALSEGTLTVQCDSTAWAKQLQFIRAAILTRLSTELPDAGITGIRFIGPDVPSWKWGPRAIPGRGPRDTYG